MTNPSCTVSITVALSKVPELAQVGGSIKIIDPALSDSLIVARTGEADYVAASIHCTHRGVEVEYHHDKKCFKCSSMGGSKFELDGTRAGGPAKDPLKTYGTSVANDELTIRTSA